MIPVRPQNTTRSTVFAVVISTRIGVAYRGCNVLPSKVPHEVCTVLATPLTAPLWIHTHIPGFLQLHYQ